MIDSNPASARLAEPQGIALWRRLAAFIILFAIYQSAEGIGGRVLNSFAVQASAMIAMMIAAWPVGRWLLKGGGYRAYALAWRPRTATLLLGCLALAFIAKATALVAGFQIGAYTSFAVSAPTDISVASIAILLALVSTFIPSIAEDILTRGLWWRATPWMTGAAFILITSVIYVLNHIFRLAEGPAEWIRLFCFGIAYAAAMARFRTLWAAVGLHWGWNLANTLLDQFTAIDGNPDLTPWVSATTHLAMAAIVLAIPQRRT